MEDSSNSRFKGPSESLNQNLLIKKLLQHRSEHHCFKRSLVKDGLRVDPSDADEIIIAENLILPSLHSLKELDILIKELEDDFTKQKKRVAKLRAAQKKETQKSLKSYTSNKIIDSELIGRYQRSLASSVLYNDLHNIQTLPRLILSLNAFREYSCCQVFVHEKGNREALSFFHGLGGSQNQSIEVEKFNHIFNTVKKSKSKLFDQINGAQDEILAMGTFLGKEHHYKNHSLIVVISRNDFLPPMSEEIQTFEQQVSFLFPIIEPILRRSKFDQKFRIIVRIFETFKIPLAIVNTEEEILYSNSFFIEDMAKSSNEISLSKGNKILIYIPEEDNNSADLYHHERISLLGELLNTLRHELSNPLFGLKLASEILSTEVQVDHDEDVITTINDISQNSIRCQEIIRNFSDLYQDESEFNNIDLKGLISETFLLTKSETRGLEFTATYKGSLEDNYTIFTNPTWLSQILFNLIVNGAQAIKSHSSTGTIKIEATVASEHLDISIEDSGPGIPQSEAEKVFSPFFTTKREGTGLGLSICRNLAQKLGGELRLDNTNSRGSLFTLSLPL